MTSTLVIHAVVVTVFVHIVNSLFLFLSHYFYQVVDHSQHRALFEGRDKARHCAFSMDL